MDGLSILSDNVSTRDLLGFGRYVDPLTALFVDPAVETPLTVGFFGTWGSGKSTLISLLDARLSESTEPFFLRVHFNPWIHRKEPNMLVPLLHTLHDTLESSFGARFAASASKITSVLLALGADALLKTMTGGRVSIDKLDKLEEKYNKHRGRVESEYRTLRQKLQECANDVHKAGGRIVFFIDDLDRCDPLEIIDLLESIKLFFDLQHVFIVLAVDKQVIDRGIAVRYAKFDLGQRSVEIGAEYLEKMVQVPLHLFPLSVVQVQKCLEALTSRDSVKKQIPLLVKLAPTNPRKLKRIVNLFLLNEAIAARTSTIGPFSPEVILRLVVLQVQSPLLYSKVSAEPDLLLALEESYSRKRKPTRDDYARFGERQDGAFAFCTENYRPDSYLARLFADGTFGNVGEQVIQYLTLLGN